MREFSTADLNKQVGEVTDAASKGPVVITRHNRPRFVLMSVEHFERLRGAADPRRAYGPGETPADVAAMFADALDALARGDGYGDEP